jgi:pseudaminic acid cytidylyltransferase
MSVLCIIPARGGSKRIPDKNIRPFAGKPMVAHSILTAKACGLFDHVIVSTDSDEIAAIAVEWGAEVPFRRPAELADDFAGTDAVFLHGIQEAEKLHGPCEHACCIYATAPLLQADYIRQGYALLREHRASTAFGVATYPAPIFRALKIDKRGRLGWHWPEFAMTRSQDLPAAVQDAGQFYWVDVARFKAYPDTMNGDAIPVLLPRQLVQDIDTPEDWAIAEMLHLAAQQSKAGRAEPAR